MPATVKVQVSRARDLPIMDKSSELTDAFAEVCSFVFMLLTPFTRNTCKHLHYTTFYGQAAVVIPIIAR